MLHQFESYPFEKLRTLLSNSTPPQDSEIFTLTIGEPQFPTPQNIVESLQHNAPLLNKYPKASGEDYLKDAQLHFIKQRYKISLTYQHIIPTFGTREVLFNFPQFYLYGKANPTIAYPNPFYQIYEGAAIASKAKVIYMNLTKRKRLHSTTHRKPTQRSRYCDSKLPQQSNRQSYGYTLSCTMGGRCPAV